MAGEEAGGPRTGTTERLTGGVATATCLESNYWLTHLDLSWNKVGRALVWDVGVRSCPALGLRGRVPANLLDVIIEMISPVRIGIVRTCP